MFHTLNNPAIYKPHDNRITQLYANSVTAPPTLNTYCISDINYEIADSTVSCFADDTRILPGIKDENDTQMLQNDSLKLNKWADAKNMKFNANKFELLRY